MADEKNGVSLLEVRKLIRARAKEVDGWHALDAMLGDAADLDKLMAAKRAELDKLGADEAAALVRIDDAKTQAGQIIDRAKTEADRLVAEAAERKTRGDASSAAATEAVSDRQGRGRRRSWPTPRRRPIASRPSPRGSRPSLADDRSRCGARRSSA